MHELICRPPSPGFAQFLPAHRCKVPRGIKEAWRSQIDWPRIGTSPFLKLFFLSSVAMPSESQQVREEVNGLKHILRERQADLAGRDVLDTVQGTFQSIRTQEGRALSFASGWPHSHYVCLQVR